MAGLRAGEKTRTSAMDDIVTTPQPFVIPGAGDIPPAEMARILHELAMSYRHLSYPKVIRAYRQAGCVVIPSPEDRRIADRVIAALGTETALSVIRIGDGEGNLLAYQQFEGTPTLDLHCFAASITNQTQQFRLSPTGIAQVQGMMREAVAAADIVGVRGPWSRADLPPIGWWPGFMLRALVRRVTRRHRLRGIVGVVRSTDIMLRQRHELARRSQTVTSAHLYLSFVRHLPDLLAASRRVVCITSRPGAVERFARAMPNVRFETVSTGPDLRRAVTLPEAPDFLDTVMSALDADLRGTLCLVGAGIWSEVYCTRIKARGGVAVDLGSGFDLLDGVQSRFVHKHLDEAVLGPARAAGLAAPTVGRERRAKA